ncbi:MAG TPA: class I SAM-dependent methyltransferase [Candidatus Saccharibacteria bacterium]|mgnify:CR=1 FL=1|nr:class I SAM-dependent methyltransferase [Candidatus Saccharibacteria bacterium]
MSALIKARVILVEKKATNKVKESRRICIACDSKKFTNYGEQLVKCTGCGLVVAKEIPTFAELQKLYEEEYFFGMEYSDYKADRPALEKNFRTRINHLKKYLQPKSKVLEIGCAYGYFLNMIKEDVSWHKGYDVSKEGIDYAVKELSVNATAGDFLDDKSIKNNSLDLVCMWDVMEHFGEPQKHVEKAAKLLKKGGAMCFTTGDVGAFVARTRGDKWRMVHPPTHIYYFNVEGATKLLKKHGLKVVSVKYRATHRNAGSVLQQLVVNKKAKNKSAKTLELGHKLATKTGLDKLNFPLNLYDVMEVTAVKE